MAKVYKYDDVLADLLEMLSPYQETQKIVNSKHFKAFCKLVDWMENENSKEPETYGEYVQK